MRNVALLNEHYEPLVDLIYRIPIDAQAWPTFCKKLIELLDVSYIHIQSLDFKYNVLSYSNGFGKLPPEEYAQAEVNYLHYPKDADPRWVDFLNPQRQGWYQCHHYVTEEFVEKSQFYQNILLPYDLRYVATHDLIWDETICVYWSLSTSKARQPLNQQELEYLSRFNKHLKRVANIERHRFEYSSKSLAGYGLIDKISQPILLINLSGHIIHANEQAKEFLNTHKSISSNNNQLLLPKQQHQQLHDNLYRLEVLYRQQNLLNSEALNDNYIHFIDEDGQSIYLFLSLLVSEQEQRVFGNRPLVMLNMYCSGSGIENFSSLYRVFDRLNTGVVLIDRHENVFYKNLFAKRILENSNILTLQIESNAQQLKVIKKFQEKFTKLLSSAYQKEKISADDVQLEHDLTVLYDDDELIILNAIPILHFSANHTLPYLEDVVAIFIRQPAKNYLLREVLKDKYKLTNREIEICHLFMNKMNLEETANACSVTKNSLRTYLKNIFAKLEVNSQAELMHVLLSTTIQQEC